MTEDTSSICICWLADNNIRKHFKIQDKCKQLSILEHFRMNLAILLYNIFLTKTRSVNSL